MSTHAQKEAVDKSNSSIEVIETTMDTRLVITPMIPLMNVYITSQDINKDINYGYILLENNTTYILNEDLVVDNNNFRGFRYSSTIPSNITLDGNGYTIKLPVTSSPITNWSAFIANITIVKNLLLIIPSNVTSAPSTSKIFYYELSTFANGSIYNVPIALSINTYYKLTQNITITTNTYFTTATNGSTTNKIYMIDGCGFTITISGCTYYNGLFTNNNTGTFWHIKNLNVDARSSTISPNKGWFLTDENVFLENCSLVSNNGGMIGRTTNNSKIILAKQCTAIIYGDIDNSCDIDGYGGIIGSCGGSSNYANAQKCSVIVFGGIGLTQYITSSANLNGGGGGIIGGSWNTNSSYINCRNCAVTVTGDVSIKEQILLNLDNRGTGGGGGIIGGNASNVNVSACSVNIGGSVKHIASLYSKGGGGGIVGGGSYDINVRDCSVVIMGDIINSYLGGSGGILGGYNSNVSITGCAVKVNSIINNGTFYNSIKPIWINGRYNENPTSINERYGAGGGGILGGNNINATIKGCSVTVISNIALNTYSGGGGGIIGGGNTNPTVVGCAVNILGNISNSAPTVNLTDGTINVALPGGNGGIIGGYNSTITIRDCTVYTNRILNISNDGSIMTCGGIASGSGNSGTTTITNCVVKTNTIGGVVDYCSGGIIGKGVETNIDSDIYIKNCYVNVSTIIGPTVRTTAGIIGGNKYMSSIIQNCYICVNTSITNAYAISANISSIVSNCYAVGYSITKTNFTSGIVSISSFTSSWINNKANSCLIGYPGDTGDDTPVWAGSSNNTPYVHLSYILMKNSLSNSITAKRIDNFQIYPNSQLELMGPNFVLEDVGGGVFPIGSNTFNPPDRLIMYSNKNQVYGPSVQHNNDYNSYYNINIPNYEIAIAYSSPVLVNPPPTNDPTLDWISQYITFNTSKEDLNPKIVVDVYGFTYTVYESMGTISGKNNPNSPNISIIVFKLNPRGTILWAKESSDINYAGTNTNPSIAVDIHGCSYVTYQTTDSSNTTSIALFKLDPNGHTLWNTEIIPKTKFYNLNPVISLNNSNLLNNIYIAYQSKETNSNTNPSGDIVVISFTYDGEFRWARDNPSFNTIYDDVFPSIGVDINENIYIAYQTTGVASGKTITTQYYNNIVIFKLDIDGSLKLINETPSDGYDNTNPSLAVDDNGNCFIAYQTYSSYNNQNPSNYNTIMILKYDTNLNLLWKKEPIYATNDNVYPSLTTNIYGNVFLTFQTMASVSGGQANANYMNIVVCALDASGIIEYISENPGLNVIYGNNITPSISADSAGNVYVAYATLGTASGNTNTGNYDIVVFKLGKNPVACLLEGTMVHTPMGYFPIETIKVGDSVISHTGKVRKVTKVGSWKCLYANRKQEDTLYKIPAGHLRASQDVFLSYYHKILQDNRILYPATLGFKEAEYHEITKDGYYTMYNIAIEKGHYNYLVVNGGCIVESWIV